jgi:hypothetical protein
MKHPTCNFVWGAIYLLFVHTLPNFWSSNVAALCVREPAWWQALSEIISGFRTWLSCLAHHLSIMWMRSAMTCLAASLKILSRAFFRVQTALSDVHTVRHDITRLHISRFFLVAFFLTFRLTGQNTKLFYTLVAAHKN